MSEETKTVTVTLTLDDVNVVFSALGELPAKVSIGLIDKLRAQLGPQLQQQAPAGN